MPSLASLLFTRSMTHPLAERQNGRFHARTACQRERARVKGKGRNGRGQGASEWIPPCGKAREKQLPPGRGGKLAAASRRERFRVCSCSGSFCLAQELAKEWVVELVSRSEEHTSELQSRLHLVCRLLLEKKNNNSAYAAAATSRVSGRHSRCPSRHW